MGDTGVRHEVLAEIFKRYADLKLILNSMQREDQQFHNLIIVKLVIFSKACR